VHSRSLHGHVSEALSCIYPSVGQVQVLIQLPVWLKVPQVLAQPLAQLLEALDLGDVDGLLGTIRNAALVALIGPKWVHPHHLVHRHLWLPHV